MLFARAPQALPRPFRHRSDLPHCASTKRQSALPHTHTTPLCHSHNKEHSKESLGASDIGREINYSTYRYDLRWLWTTTVNLVEMVMEPTHVPGLTAHKLPRICFFSTACKEAILWRCENKSNLNSSHNCCGVNDVSLSLLGGMVLIQ